MILHCILEIDYIILYNRFLKNSHQKKKCYNYVKWWILTKFSVVNILQKKKHKNILQYTHTSNHVVHLKLIQWYVSVLCYKPEGKNSLWFSLKKNHCNMRVVCVVEIYEAHSPKDLLLNLYSSSVVSNSLWPHEL